MIQLRLLNARFFEYIILYIIYLAMIFASDKSNEKFYYENQKFKIENKYYNLDV